MDWTESKLKIRERADALNSRFAESFNSIQVGSRPFFLGPDGASLFALDFLGPYGALVIEYADDYDTALAGQLEDGELFFLDEMDEDAMFLAMLNEIEN